MHGPCDQELTHKPGNSEIIAQSGPDFYAIKHKALLSTLIDGMEENMGNEFP